MNDLRCVLKKGDWFIAYPEHRPAHQHLIEVRRVAKDRSWADIAVRTWAVMWTKRQPLVDGDFAFPYETFGWDFPFFVRQEQDHMAWLAENEGVGVQR